MTAWRFDRIEGCSRALRVEITGERPPLDPQTEAKVAELWERERALRPALFNGAVFSVDAIDTGAGRLGGHWTEYRRILAQLRRPELAARMTVRPLAVAGLIEGPDGLLLGRRPAQAAYQPGEWQFAPAGNVDPASSEGARIDVLRALYAELREELGLPPEALRDVRPICLLHHPGIGIVDLGVAARTDLTEAAIRAAHASGGDGEYPELAFVRRADIPAFLQREGRAVGAQVVPFLRALGILPEV